MTNITATFKRSDIKRTAKGKQFSAWQFYLRGRQFIRAALALDQDDPGDGYVVRHLLCQGIELILKALLLRKNYNNYFPLLSKKKYGHNLIALLDEVARLYKVKVAPDLLVDLRKLNSFFKAHLFRYSDIEAMFSPATSFPITRTLEKLLPLMKAMDRRMRP